MKYPILFAEDDHTEIFFFERAFNQTQLPISRHYVQNGAEAIAWLAGLGQYCDRKRFPFPALLVIDIKMPKVDGFQVVRWIRNQPKFKELPVIIFSTSEHSADRIHAKQLGVTDYISKTPSCGDLVRYLEKFVGTVET